MKEIHVYENMEQFKVVTNITRYRMMNLLVNKPMTGSQLARALEIPRQLAHYHLKILFNAGLVELVEETINKGRVEKSYRSIAENFSAGAILGVEQRRNVKREMRLRKTEYLRDASLSFLEQARLDLEQKNAAEKMSGFHIPFQQETIILLDSSHRFPQDISSRRATNSTADPAEFQSAISKLRNPFNPNRSLVEGHRHNFRLGFQRNWEVDDRRGQRTRIHVVVHTWPQTFKYDFQGFSWPDSWNRQ